MKGNDPVFSEPSRIEGACYMEWERVDDSLTKSRDWSCTVWSRLSGLYAARQHTVLLGPVRAPVKLQCLRTPSPWHKSHMCSVQRASNNNKDVLAQLTALGCLDDLPSLRRHEDERRHCAECLQQAGHTETPASAIQSCVTFLSGTARTHTHWSMMLGGSMFVCKSVSQQVTFLLANFREQRVQQPNSSFVTEDPIFWQ